MNHLEEEQLVTAYYGQLDPKLKEHLRTCQECRAEFERLEELLNSVRESPIPARGDSYGREVWTRIQPQLPAGRPARHWFRRWAMAPTLAALVVLAFVGGMLTQEHRQVGLSEKARERVLLIALSNHLERSQILLTELVNAGPGTRNPEDERERARDLADENRLLRQTALRTGNRMYASLLDDLERVLLDVANSPAELRSPDLAEVRQRIEDEGLLFKVRITSTDARRKEQEL